MSSLIKNVGFTKTVIRNNGKNIQNDIKWSGDYDGNFANIEIDVNDNGNHEFMSMKLNNNDLKNLLGVQPIPIPLEKRLQNDFLSNKLYTLENSLIKSKSLNHSRSHNRSHGRHSNHSHSQRRKTQRKIKSQRKRKTQRKTKGQTKRLH